MKLNSITRLLCLSSALLLVPVSTSLASIYSSTFSYDVPNGKVTKTDPNNKRLEYSYDVVNRLSGIKLLDAAGVPEFKYYYDLTDQLERITYPGGEQVFTYDDFDRLESIKDFGQTNPLLAFDYDHKDRITWIAYMEEGGEVCYEYDPDGRMTRVGRVLPQGVRTVCSAADEITDFNYDVKGRLETIDYPNGVQKFQEYSVTTGQITRVGYRKQPSGDLIYSDTFVYIPNSNLYDTVTRTTSGGSEVSDYDYDDYQRLTEVVEANGRKTVFEYDDFGNRIRETITNINNPTATGGTPKAYGEYQYIYGPRSNRLVRILKDGVELERFVYDNAGRITQRTHAVNGVTEYTFDDRGYLTKVVKPTSTIEYTYDALGVRKTKTVDGVTTRFLTANIFGFSHVLMELDTAMNIKSTYAYAGHLPLKEEPVAADRNQDLYLLHSGVVGSITHALDGAGNIKHEYSYDAFGNRSNVSATGSSHQHYGYTGEEYDEETGLLYLRARYYDPMLGRFISADPYWGRLEEPVTQNRFIYVHNNPFLYTDPTGLVGMLSNWCVTGGVGVGGTGCTVAGVVVDWNPSFDIGYDENGDFNFDFNLIDVDGVLYNQVGGGGYAGASGGATLTFELNSVENKEQLLGLGGQVGGTVGEGLVLEGGFVTGQDYTGLYFGGGIGAGVAPLATYGFVTNTYSPFEDNVFSFDRSDLQFGACSK